MSTRVELDIRRDLHLGLIEDGIQFFIKRIIGRIKFINFIVPTFFDAIIDTGSPVTIIPQYIWKDEDVPLFEHKNESLFGFGQSSVKGHLAKTNIVFADNNNVSPILEIKAYLIHDDSMPLIIGMEEIIDNVDFIIRSKTKEYYLEF